VPFSSLVYNPSAARYIASNGRFISGKAVRAIIDADIDAASQRMVQHGDTLKVAARAFKNGEISQDEYTAAVRDWRDKMAADVKAQHLGQGAAACGGFHNLNQSRYGSIGAALKVQYAYLGNTAIELAGNPDLALGEAKGRRSLDDRAKAFAQASRGTFERLQQMEHIDAGFAYEENELHADEHCKGLNSCEAETARGRVPIGTLIMVGKRKCKVFCKCTINYFKSAAVEQ
jgi:hypothetical protein